MLSLIILPFLIEDSFAQTPGRYSDYEIIDNGDGTFTNRIGLPAFIQDSKGNWVDHIVTESQNTIRVDSLQTPFVFDKTTCELHMHEKKLFSQGANPLLSNISWGVEEADFREDPRTGLWSGVSQNNLSCSVTSFTDQNGAFHIEALKQDANGIIKVELVKEIEKSLKRNIVYQHLDATKLTSKFGFSETFTIPIASIDRIIIAGKEFDSSKFSLSQSFDRNNILVPDIAFLVGNDVLEFDMSQGFDDFSYVDIEKVGTDIVFTVKYRNDSDIILFDKITENDPTFGFTAGTGYVSQTGLGTGVSCPTPSSTSTWHQLLKTGSTESGAPCRLPAFEWDISSITDGSTVTDTQIRFTPSSVQQALNCDYRSMEFQPSILGAQDLWNDILNGTVFVNDTSVCSIESLQTLDLGSSADSDVEGNLVDDWWAVGLAFDDMSRDSVRHRAQQNTVELEVTYTTGGGTTVDVTDEHGFEDSVSIVTSQTINITDQHGFEDSVSIQTGNIVSPTDQHAFEDSVVITTSNTINITDEHGFEDSTTLQAGNVINVIDQHGFEDSAALSTDTLAPIDQHAFEDSVQVIVSNPVFNAIRLSLNSAGNNTLGGVFAGMCDFAANYTMVGIWQNGTIRCEQLP